MRIKRKWIIAIVVLGLFVAFNPSRKEFAEYLGNSTDADGFQGLKGKVNFLLISIYEGDEEIKYLGIFK